MHLIIKLQGVQELTVLSQGILVLLETWCWGYSDEMWFTRSSVLYLGRTFLCSCLQQLPGPTRCPGTDTKCCRIMYFLLRGQFLLCSLESCYWFLQLGAELCMDSSVYVYKCTHMNVWVVSMDLQMGNHAWPLWYPSTTKWLAQWIQGE